MENYDCTKPLDGQKALWFAGQYPQPENSGWEAIRDARRLGGLPAEGLFASFWRQFFDEHF
jgi:hypothetical protein